MFVIPLFPEHRPCRLQRTKSKNNHRTGRKTKRIAKHHHPPLAKWRIKRPVNQSVSTKTPQIPKASTEVKFIIMITAKTTKSRKVYSEDNLSGWTERKNQIPYNQYLEEISEQIPLLFPEDEVHNPHHQETIEQLASRYQRLHYKITRSMTLFHHPYRMMENGYNIADKEDSLLAFRLLQPLTFPSTLLRRKTRKLFIKFKRHFGYQPFTFRQAYFRARIPISSLRRHFIALENSNYITGIGGDQKNGYVYEISK